MSKVLIIERADGGVSVMHPSPEKILRLGSAEAVLESEIIRGRVPDDAISHKIVEISVLPNRTFRDAWGYSGGAIIEDMPKARIIHMDRIKIVRDAKLLEENENLEAAIDAGDTTEEAAVRSRRQTLRNLPTTSQQVTDIAAAGNTTVLNAIWPTAELGSRV